MFTGKGGVGKTSLAAGKFLSLRSLADDPAFSPSLRSRPLSRVFKVPWFRKQGPRYAAEVFRVSLRPRKSLIALPIS